jgi:hypothetical protein
MVTAMRLLHDINAVCRHQLFVDMVRSHAALPVAVAANAQPQDGACTNLGRLPNRPLDLPVYGKDFMAIEAPAAGAKR